MIASAAPRWRGTEKYAADPAPRGHNRPVAKRQKKEDGAHPERDGAATVAGVVRAFDPDEGWGVIHDDLAGRPQKIVEWNLAGQRRPNAT